MITSALISQCRREYGDQPKTTKVAKEGDASTTIFNTGEFPIVEGSYSVYKGTSAQTETTHYAIDKDTGDITFVNAPATGIEASVIFKYAHWRDQHWNEAINQAVSELNGRGFFRQIVRDATVFHISANVQAYNGPPDCVDLYQLLQSDDYTTSGNFVKLPYNWNYQQDANKIVLGIIPSKANYCKVSYMRNLKTYSATSATIDVLDDWIELVKKRAGSLFYRSLAGKVAKQANANIDEGHFSFTNLRTMANDLDTEFGNIALRKKPTRPAKDIQWHIDSGGVA